MSQSSKHSSRNASRRSSRVSMLVTVDPVEEMKKETAKIDSDLWKCCEYGYIALAKQLSAESDINAKDFVGRTPLAWACRNGHIPIVKFLMGAGAAQISSPGGLQLSHFAAHSYTENLIEDLVAAGCPVTGTDDSGNTVLHWAARRGILNPIQSFLAAGADLQALNHHGSTALHLAVNNGHVNCAAFLLKKGIAVDAADANGNTALHIAASAGFAHSIPVFVEYKANFNAKNKNGMTPLDVALDQPTKDAIKGSGGAAGASGEH